MSSSLPPVAGSSTRPSTTESTRALSGASGARAAAAASYTLPRGRQLRLASEQHRVYVHGSDSPCSSTSRPDSGGVVNSGGRVSTVSSSRPISGSSTTSAAPQQRTPQPPSQMRGGTGALTSTSVHSSSEVIGTAATTSQPPVFRPRRPEMEPQAPGWGRDSQRPPMFRLAVVAEESFARRTLRNVEVATWAEMVAGSFQSGVARILAETGIGAAYETLDSIETMERRALAEQQESCFTTSILRPFHRGWLQITLLVNIQMCREMESLQRERINAEYDLLASAVAFEALESSARCSVDREWSCGSEYCKGTVAVAQESEIVLGALDAHFLGHANSMCLCRSQFLCIFSKVVLFNFSEAVHAPALEAHAEELQRFRELLLVLREEEADRQALGVQAADRAHADLRRVAEFLKSRPAVLLLQIAAEKQQQDNNLSRGEEGEAPSGGSTSWLPFVITECHSPSSAPSTRRRPVIPSPTDVLQLFALGDAEASARDCIQAEAASITDFTAATTSDSECLKHTIRASQRILMAWEAVRRFVVFPVAFATTAAHLWCHTGDEVAASYSEELLGRHQAYCQQTIMEQEYPHAIEKVSLSLGEYQQRLAVRHTEAVETEQRLVFHWMEISRRVAIASSGLRWSRAASRALYVGAQQVQRSQQQQQRHVRSHNNNHPSLSHSPSAPGRRKSMSKIHGNNSHTSSSSFGGIELERETQTIIMAETRIRLRLRVEEETARRVQWEPQLHAFVDELRGRWAISEEFLLGAKLLAVSAEQERCRFAIVHEESGDRAFFWRCQYDEAMSPPRPTDPPPLLLAVGEQRYHYDHHRDDDEAPVNEDDADEVVEVRRKPLRPTDMMCLVGDLHEFVPLADMAAAFAAAV